MQHNYFLRCKFLLLHFEKKGVQFTLLNVILVGSA
jgi:hypothetical protein